MLSQFLILSLTGITGAENAISTRGYFDAKMLTENGTQWPALVHAIDDEFAGPYDGYLGFDFMLNYAVIINFGTRTIQSNSGTNLNENNEEASIIEVFDEQPEIPKSLDASWMNQCIANAKKSRQNTHSADATMNESNSNINLSNDTYENPSNYENLNAQRAPPSTLDYAPPLQTQQNKSSWNAEDPLQLEENILSNPSETVENPQNDHSNNSSLQTHENEQFWNTNNLIFESTKFTGFFHTNGQCVVEPKNRPS